MAEVSMHPDAEAEYEAALAWYLTRSVRVAADFEAAVDQAVGFLAAFPEASPLCDEIHRYCSLKRFPYGLITRTDGSQVRIVAVTHDRQLPEDWAARD